jgi:hypothetical protein
LIVTQNRNKKAEDIVEDTRIQNIDINQKMKEEGEKCEEQRLLDHQVSIDLAKQTRR